MCAGGALCSVLDNEELEIMVHREARNTKTRAWRDGSAQAIVITWGMNQGMEDSKQKPFVPGFGEPQALLGVAPFACSHPLLSSQSLPLSLGR